MGCQNSPICIDQSYINVKNNDVLKIYPFQDISYRYKKMNVKKSSLLKYINISQDEEFEYNITQKIEKKEKQTSNIKNQNIHAIKISHNLKNYFTYDITKEKIDEIVFNAMNEFIVDDKNNFIPGKNVTKEQVEKIAEILYKKVEKINGNIDTQSSEEEEDKDYSILNNMKIKIEITELDKKTAQKILNKDNDTYEDEKINDINVKENEKEEQKVKLLLIKLG